MLSITAVSFENYVNQRKTTKNGLKIVIAKVIYLVAYDSVKSYSKQTCKEKSCSYRDKQ